MHLLGRLIPMMVVSDASFPKEQDAQGGGTSGVLRLLMLSTLRTSLCVDS